MNYSKVNYNTVCNPYATGTEENDVNSVGQSDKALAVSRWESKNDVFDLRNICESKHGGRKGSVYSFKRLKLDIKNKMIVKYNETLPENVGDKVSNI